MLDSTERRLNPRVSLEADVLFRRPREGHYSITMHDLTPHGCKLAVPERLDKGDLVWVQLPSLESLQGWVRWTQKAWSGVEFERPMHPAVFEMMAERLAPASA